MQWDFWGGKIAIPDLGIKHSNGEMNVLCEDVLYLLLEKKSLILLVFESHISYFICYLYSPYDSFQRTKAQLYVRWCEKPNKSRRAQEMVF